MARKAAPEMQQSSNINEDALQDGAQSLSLVSANTAQAAAMMNYDQPYNCERIVQETRFYMSQSAEAMLEAGKRLVILKEHEGHGEFTEIVEEQLGIPARTARQMMQAAVKYLTNPSLGAKAQTFAALGKSKMFELMTMDDEQLVELSEGRSVVGLTLRDVDHMSVRELKAALIEARESQAATEKVLATKNQKLDKLASQLERKKTETPTMQWTWQPVRQQLIEAGESMANFAQTELRRAFADIDAQAEQLGEGLPDDIDTLRGQVLSAVMQTLVTLQKDFGLPVDLTSIAVPEWMQSSEPEATDKKAK
jgi:hypothetical protein